MKKLTAKRSILYGGRMYEAGDALPAHDRKMTEAWLRAGSAAVIDTEAELEKLLSGNAGKEAAALDADGAQDAPNVGGGDNTPPDGDGGENGAQSGGNGTGGGDGEAEQTVTGHLDRQQLEDMNKDKLVQLAEDMGVKLPRGATKAVIIDLLTRAEVEAPAQQNGGAQ